MIAWIGLIGFVALVFVVLVDLQHTIDQQNKEK
jgi:hypothetical protein